MKKQQLSIISKALHLKAKELAIIAKEKGKIQQELFVSNQRLEALMNALPVGVTFSTDATCEHITGNPAIIRQMELKPGDNISASTHNKTAVGTKLRHYMNGRLMTAKDMPMQRAIAENREIGPMEIEVVLPSGKRWLMEAVGAPIRDSYGNIVASVAVNIDITERKRLDLVKETKRLLDEERSKVESIADATHELRTPIAIIKGNVDLALLSPGKNPKPARSALRAINYEIKHISSILSELSLITSKAWELKNRILFEELHLKSLIRVVVERCKALAYKKNISIQTGKIPDTTVLGDKMYLEKMLINLIKNSIIYGATDGHTKIDIRKNNGYIVIRVIDDGIGISAEDLPHVFERFYRADKFHSSGGNSIGLGLAIVKWIAEVHGGTVSAESVKNKGSVFSVSFPIKTVA
ncbi:MAG: ATP-binding protein [bacterium]|nr:ATP-binding protein [bacterium]